MNNRKKIEFGDFQTPIDLAETICHQLIELGISPNTIIEPTCGVGAFILSAATVFPSVQEIHGFDINPFYLEQLKTKLTAIKYKANINLTQADFFKNNWQSLIDSLNGGILILGNFPWVTNTTQSIIGSDNLPKKSNFLNHTGFDAISGKANFDISEWMLLELLRCFSGRSGNIAMLIKTSVARKILAHAKQQKLAIRNAKLFTIDTKKTFNACVDACLLVIALVEQPEQANYDYAIYDSLFSQSAIEIKHKDGLVINNLSAFESGSFLIGQCPQKWRSGIKHDAASVMELTRNEYDLMQNGLCEVTDIETDFLYPLLKGSDIANNKSWQEKFVLVPQRFVGEPTDAIQLTHPKTWQYLENHAVLLDKRASIIYKKNPRFSIFGIGDYTFRPWKIAICSLYKSLRFRLIAPIENKPVMFDDTVYYLSFDNEKEAKETFALLTSKPSINLLSSLIFWDDKRPIKTSILNKLDWSKLNYTQNKTLYHEIP